MVVVLLSCAVLVLLLIMGGLMLLIVGFSQMYTKMEKRALVAEEALARQPLGYSWQTQFTVPLSPTQQTDTYQS